MNSIDKSLELHDRLIRHASSIIELVEQLRPILPATLRQQLLRSGTAAHALYAEAQRAESRDDFIHKLAVAFKELTETDSWLRLCALRKPGLGGLAGVRDETQQLMRILGACRRTATRRTTADNG